MPITINLPEEADKQLSEIAKQTGQTKEDLVKDIVLEELNDISLAEERLREFQAGNSKTYSLEEIERELGLWSEDIFKLARKYVWWKQPEDALKDQNHFLAQIMTYGTAEDSFWLLKQWGEEPFIKALQNPPVGVFNGRSWHFWHYRLGLAKDVDEVPPLPKREDVTYDSF